MSDRIYDVAVFGDSPPRLGEAMTFLGSLASLKLINVANPPRVLDGVPRMDFVNVDMRSIATLTALKSVFGLLPSNRRARIFAVDPASHVQVTQSHALGATSLLNRPLDQRRLVGAVLDTLSRDTPPPPLAADKEEVTLYAGSVLRDLLMTARIGAEMPLQELESIAGTLVESIAGASLSEWINAVRRNHSATFEHCLTVTAITVAFGLQVGIGSKDLTLLATAAMVHDVGKAFIPVEILEKPGRLDARETQVVKLHPALGYEVLRKAGAPQPLLDVTLNHHEYLDGSGYPNGLKGSQISDITRVLTIADIFSALIERRAYKEPVDPLRAHQMLVDMGLKLDMPLVRAFRPIAERLVRHPLDFGKASFG